MIEDIFVVCTTTLFRLEKNKFSLRFKLIAHQRLRFFESLVLCVLVHKAKQYCINFVITGITPMKRRYRALYLVRHGMMLVLSAHAGKVDYELFHLFVFLVICLLTNVKLIYASFIQAVFSYNSGLLKSSSLYCKQLLFFKKI